MVPDKAVRFLAVLYQRLTARRKRPPPAGTNCSPAPSASQMKSFSPSLGKRKLLEDGTLDRRSVQYRRHPQISELEPPSPERSGSDRHHRGGRDRVRGGGSAELRPARRRRRARQRAAVVHP